MQKDLRKIQIGIAFIRALEYNKGRRNRNQSAFSFRSQNFNNKGINKNIFLLMSERLDKSKENVLKLMMSMIIY